MTEADPAAGTKIDGKVVPRLTMVFEPQTIEHLGTKLYSTLPPVVGELVSNAWDADSPSVEIALPEGKITPESEVVVRDYGSGMDPEIVQSAYLKIGRNRREADGTASSPKGRPLMGRKGLGKLSPFGIAREVEVRTIHSGYAVTFRMDYDVMKTHSGGNYCPEVVVASTGKTADKNGTQVTIRRLLRKTPVDVDSLRRGLARRFAVFGGGFVLKINGTSLSPEDQRLREQCSNAWSVEDLDVGSTVDAAQGWKVTGWMGLTEASSLSDRGVDVFVHGKTAELNTTFDLKTTHAEFGRAYLVGQVHADFLDEDEDLISTGRNSVHWESGAGEALAKWGRLAVTEVLHKWKELRRAEKEQRVKRVAGWDTWLESRPKREQRVAKALLGRLLEDDEVTVEAARPLVEAIKTNVEFVAFQEFVDEIETEGGMDVPTLLKLFSEWSVLEAREHLKLSDGRLEILEKLAEFIKKGALEVQELQPLFERNGWLVEPGWGRVEGQVHYSELLRDKFPDKLAADPKNRRIDLLAYDAAGDIYVVELKQPHHTLSWDDLDQIERYVAWMRAHVGKSDPTKIVRGILIVGDLGNQADVHQKRDRLSIDGIRVDDFRGLLRRAENVFGKVEESLKEIAPEYSKKARRERRRRA